MKQKNLPVILTLVALALFVGVVGSQAYQNKQEKPEALDTLKVAFQEADINNIVLLDIAEEKGYFKQNGLKIERKGGLKNISTYLTSGQVDVGITALISPVSDYYANQDIKILTITDRLNSSMRVVSRYPEEKLGEVKNVATNRPGGTQQNVFWLISKNLGINADKVKYVVAAEPQLAAALLEKGTLDLALVSNEGAYKKLMANEALYSVSTDVAYKNTDIPDGIYSSGKVLDKNGKTDALKRFILATELASDYFNNHQNEMINFMVAKYGYTKADASATYTRIVASKEGAHFVQDVNLLSDISAAVIKNTKPLNPSRNLEEIFASDFK